MKISFFAFLFFAGVSALAQQTLNPDLRLQEKIYKHALENSDLEAATMAVYQIIALQPEKDSWHDTLCLLYHGRGYYLQSAKIAQKILEKKPESLAFREVLAQAFENTGNYLEALRQYDKLVKADSNAVFMYKTALMQYLLRYYNDCEITINNILKNAKTEDLSINTQVDQSSSALKQVPLRAAALNILGVIYMDMNKKEPAIDAFEKALELYPDYMLVKENLKKIKSSSTP